MLLVLTSMMFTIPAAIAHLRRFRRDRLLATALTSCSILNHGHKSENRLIRKVDVTLAHGIGAYYVVNSISTRSFLDTAAIALVAQACFVYYKKALDTELSANHQMLWHALMHISTAMCWSLYLLLK